MQWIYEQLLIIQLKVLKILVWVFVGIGKMIILVGFVKVNFILRIFYFCYNSLVEKVVKGKFFCNVVCKIVYSLVYVVYGIQYVYKKMKNLCLIDIVCGFDI